MTRHKLESEFWIPAPLDQVWDLYADPANLAELTPPRYGAAVKADGPMRDGAQVTITMAPLGIPVPLPWVALISDYNAVGPSRGFKDTQTSGPFKYWRHHHMFVNGIESVTGQKNSAKITVARPGAWVRDSVEYEMPLGPLGEIARTIFARKNLENMFFFRRQKTFELLGIAL